MIEGTPLSQLAQQLIAERQTQRDFIADTRRLIPHQAGASVLIELEHNGGTTTPSGSGNLLFQHRNVNGGYTAS